MPILAKRETSVVYPGHSDRLNMFIKHYNIEEKYGGLILYKAVCKDGQAWYIKTETAPYQPGTEVACNDYDIDPNQCCGSGLHVCPLADAKDFRTWTLDVAGMHIIECLVMPEDIICVPYEAAKARPLEIIKVRCKKLLVLRVLED
jgi:hypothetical protein